jgi:hypothetical protein
VSVKPFRISLPPTVACRSMISNMGFSFQKKG